MTLPTNKSPIAKRDIFSWVCMKLRVRDCQSSIPLTNILFIYNLLSSKLGLSQLKKLILGFFFPFFIVNYAAFVVVLLISYSPSCVTRILAELAIQGHTLALRTINLF